MTNNNKTISLVLGSGGARGLAHIGVIKVLEQQGYQIQSISGASMGALIGGIYAAGELDTYTDWICSLNTIDVLKLLDISFSGSSLFKGERIIETLRELIGPRDIEDLPLDFTAVATDLDANREVWLSSGPLFEAIRASIAFPTIFSAVNYHGKTLVDGGMLNPVPIAPTLRDNTDMTIAVSLNGVRHHNPEIVQQEVAPDASQFSYQQRIFDFIESLPFRNGDHEEVRGDAGFFEIISKSIDAMQTTISKLKMAAYSPDLVIELPKDICTIYEFERAAEMIEIGRREALRVLSETQG